MWHASVSFQAPSGPLRLDSLPRPLLERVEQTAKQLTAGVGTGPRRWEQGERAHHVLHVRRRLSDGEIAQLPPGPDPIDSAGGGPLWRPRTTKP